MDKIDLGELERLAAQATPGPWMANNWGRVWYTSNHDSKRLVCDTMRNTVRNPKSSRANARLIAAMRNAVPELIARVRELERQREILAGKIGTLTRWYDAMAGCEEGQKLEAENADLRNQLRDALERC